MDLLNSFSFEGLSLVDKINAVKKLKQLARKGENLIISEQLAEPSADNVGGNLVCDDEDDNCVCTDFMYINNIIPNRRDLAKPFLYNEYLKCGHDTIGVKRGIYQISCIKDNCQFKGVIYVGKSITAYRRITEHISVITAPIKNYRKVKMIHQHFINNDHDINEHFRYSILEEIKYDATKPDEILVRENFWMDYFGTFRSWYGCNRSRNKIMEEESVEKQANDDPGPSSAKKSKSQGDKVEWAGNPDRKGKNYRTKDHSEEKWLIALVLKNLDNQRGTSSDLKGFSQKFFKPEYEIDVRGKHDILLRCFDEASRGHQSAKESLEDWFTQAPYVKSEQPLQYKVGGGPPPKYTYGLNPAMLTVIEEELQDEFYNGSFDDFMYTIKDLIVM